jgi:PilZ domain
MTQPATNVVERREQQRFPCEPPLHASFDCPTGSILAKVEDISVAGAKLRICKASSRMPMQVQGEFDYTFETVHGSLQCRARTAWVQRVGDDLRVGIEYVGLSENPEDPLRIALDKLCPLPQAG